MSSSTDKLTVQLNEHFGDKLERISVATGQVTVQVAVKNLLAVCKELRDSDDFSFEQLSDLCGVDYLTYGDTTSTGFSRGVSPDVEKVTGHQVRPRYAVVYHLLSIKHNRRLRIKCFIVNDPPRIDSVLPIWASANWFEREAFDLFGILFVGHPDLRRILTDYGFIGHPFRKDFPLEGKVEVRYDPDRRRVVYQPVTIENRVLVPRVIRDDNRYKHET